MKVIQGSTVFRRRAISCALASVLLCEAVPAALAQGVDASVTGSVDAASRTGSSVLELFRGEVRVIRLPGTIKRIAIGNGKLLTASVVDGRLMLLAESPGITSLVVWNEKGIALQTTVRVAKSDVIISVEQLRKVLQPVAGLRIQPVGPNIVLSGVVHRDMVPVIKSATSDLSNVVDTTSIDEGDALKKTIHFKVQIMEMTRTGQESLGIAWDSQFNGPQIGGQALFGTSGAAAAATGATNFFLAGIASNIASKINFAVNNGDAFILATPELNTRSGGVATFLAGGEVPVPKAGALGTTDVDYKPYGIKLNIKPVVDANNIITASLEAEISQLDPSVSYGGFPGFLTRKTTSDISLRAGETLAISGLVSSDALNASDGMPFLRALPIIGRLFRSDSFRSKKSDLVIFVTPLISDPSLSPNADLLGRADRFDQRYREQYGDPSPLDATGTADPASAPRHPIAPTPALPVAPTRSAPRRTTGPSAPVEREAATPVRPAPDITEALRMSIAAQPAANGQ
jgi:pilus assembly protein CpaC